jgi:hypothetical protein
MPCCNGNILQCVVARFIALDRLLECFAGAINRATTHGMDCRSWSLKFIIVQPHTKWIADPERDHRRTDESSEDSRDPERVRGGYRTLLPRPEREIQMQVQVNMLSCSCDSKRCHCAGGS